MSVNFSISGVTDRIAAWLAAKSGVDGLLRGLIASFAVLAAVLPLNILERFDVPFLITPIVLPYLIVFAVFYWMSFYKALKRKGRSPWWLVLCLGGYLAFIGIMVISFLEPRNGAKAKEA